MKAQEIFKQFTEGSALYIPDDSQIGDCYLFKPCGLSFGKISEFKNTDVDASIIVIAVVLKNTEEDLKIKDELGIYGDSDGVDKDFNIFKILSKSDPKIDYNGNDYLYAEIDWEIEKL